MPSIEAVKNPVNETRRGRVRDPSDPVTYDSRSNAGPWKPKGEFDSLRPPAPFLDQ
jgi:hypothetical protein